MVVNNCEGTYTITRTWHLVDNCGNHADDQVQTILVKDSTKPVINCPLNIIVNNTTGQCGAIISFAATATDNCSTPVITYSKNPGTFFNVGTTQVTATATDACNNQARCDFNVTVNDTEKPVITVQNLLKCFEDNDFGCSINLGVTATDNCGIQSLTSNAPTCFPVGVTIVTWTATDIHGNVSTKTQTVTRNPEINIDICAGITRTIYIGTTGGVGPFGPQSINLSSTVTGGTPGYSYSWSPATGLNNPAIANPVASPVVTTTYTLTVTDSRGCTRNLDITINVLPLSSAVCSTNGGIKFGLCHITPGNPSNPQNICISANALPAHLTGGTNGHNNCHLGPCGQQLCYSTTSGTQTYTRVESTENVPVYIEESDGEVKEVINVTEKKEEKVKFSVKVFPNPSSSDFKLVVTSNSNETITVRILDLNGVVRSMSIMDPKTKTIQVGGHLFAGTYLAEVIQGAKHKMVKLLKL